MKIFEKIRYYTLKSEIYIFKKNPPYGWGRWWKKLHRIFRRTI